MLANKKKVFYFAISLCVLSACDSFIYPMEAKDLTSYREKRESPSENFAHREGIGEFYPKATAMKMESCDQSVIPVMEDFDLEKFSGGWYELGKTLSGYIDLSDAMWKITANEGTTTFFYSGRNSKDYCIAPIAGRITSASSNPGELHLHYHTYSTTVSEKIRILYTDYTTIAVVYACLKFSEDYGSCHPAGVFGSIWTRLPHVNVTVYDAALKYLNKACIDSHSVHVRSRVGPCRNFNLTMINGIETAPDICHQSLSKGSCSANIQRFYFNVVEKKCQAFSYSGCGRNDNNFMSLLECEKNCVNTLEKMPICEETAECAIHCPPCCRKINGCVKCDCENVIVDDFIKCMSTSSSCPNHCVPQQKYQGCFVCKCDDQDLKTHLPAVCIEVKEPGQCKSKLKRFYFDAIASKCQMFDYTGCGGNNNNFESLEECMETCKGQYIWKANPLPPGENDEAVVMKIPLLLIVFSFSFLLSR